MGADRPEPPSGRRLARGASIILVLLAVAFTLYERATVLQQLERTARDFHSRLIAPRSATEIVVVQITDSDYESLFSRTSPLAAERLRELLEAIVAGSPRLVVVDLATAESQFRPLAELEDMVPVIWARESTSCERLDSMPPECAGGDRSVLLDFAGADRPGSRFGLVDMERDPDGVIRRYRLYRQVGETTRPGLAAAVLEALGDGPDDRTDDALYIRYSPLPPGAFLTAAVLLRAASAPDFGEVGVLRDRIVLLGGAYREARDKHATPLGRMFGVDLQAQVIQTELEGGGLRPVGLGAIGILLVLNSVTLLVLFRLASFGRAFWMSIAAIPLLATTCSVIFAGSPFALWPYLVPLLVAVLVQQLYAHAAHYRDELIDRLGRRVAPGVVAASATAADRERATPTPAEEDATPEGSPTSD